MKILLKQKYTGKEVKKMKKLFVLPIVVALGMILALGSNALAATTILSADEVTTTRIETTYDPFGNAIGQKTTSNTTRTVVTEETKEDGTKVQVTTVTTINRVTEASYHGGTLKVDKDNVNIDTKVNGQLTYQESYTDTYKYDQNGRFSTASGTGTVKTWDPDTGAYSEGTITRTFQKIGGQAALQTDERVITNYKDASKRNVLSTTTTKTTNTNQLMDNNQVVVIRSVTESSTIDKKDGSPTFNQKIAESKRTVENTYGFYAGSYEVDLEKETLFTKDYGDSRETVVYETSYTRDRNGVTRGLSKTLVSGERYVEDDGGTQKYLPTYTSTAAFDRKFGWYIKSEDLTWNVDPNWSGGAWGDPAATGTVFQKDGQWYMNVKVWTNDEKTAYQTITIALNLASLSPEAKADLEKILKGYAASGELLTLYGISEGDVLSAGAELMVVGLGKGSFSAHPYDFEGDTPSSLSSPNEDFADFVMMMQNSPYWNEVLGGLSAENKWKTLKELYDALVNGRLKIGGSITTSTGITFSLVAETSERNGGAGARLDSGTYKMRHFTNELSKQLGLL